MGDRAGLFKINVRILSRLKQRGVIFYKIKQKFHKIEMELTKEEEGNNVKVRVLEIKHSLKCVSLAEIAHITMKEEKNKYPYIEAIIGVRTLTGKNKEIIKHAILKDFIYGEKTKVNIKRIHYSKIEESGNSLIEEEKEKTKRNHIYIYGKSGDIYGQLFDFIGEFGENIEFGEIEIIPHKDKEIAGVRRPDKYILINMGRIFMQQNELVQGKGKIYKKKLGSVQSYEVLGELEDFLKETPALLMKLGEEFGDQLAETDINKIISDYYEEAYKVVKKIPNILVTKAIKEKTIEYKNGLYDEEGRIFLSYENKKQKTIAEQWGTIKQKEEEYEEEKENIL